MAVVPGGESQYEERTGEMMLDKIQRPIADIDPTVLDHYVAGWKTRSPRHISFRGPDFRLKTLDGLLQVPIDLSNLESLDASQNELEDLACMEGKSARLAAHGGLQGAGRFRSLAVLKARKNQIASFSAVLPMLRELDLAHNCMERVPLMGGMRRLQVVILANNKMKGEWETFGQLTGLKRLDLAFNCFDFKPKELVRQLSYLDGTPLEIFRCCDNTFTRLLPEYQAIVLWKLKALKKLDDLQEEGFEQAKVLSYSFDEKRLENYDDNSILRAKAIHQRKYDPKPSTLESQLPLFSELAEVVQEMMDDPSSGEKCIHTLVRYSSNIFAAHPDSHERIFQRRIASQEEDSNYVATQIQNFLGNYAVVVYRNEDSPSYRVLLIRSLAKLSVVHPYNLDEKCVELLGWFLKRSAEVENEVLSVVRDVVVEPLLDRTIAHPSVISIVKALSKFESEKMPQYLSPIAAWLARMYCDHGQPVREVTHLLAIATTDDNNAKRALEYNLGNRDQGSDTEAQFPKKIIAALKSKQLTENESNRVLLIGHLKLVQNTVACTGYVKTVDIYQAAGLHQQIKELLQKLLAGNTDLTRLKILDVRTIAATIDALNGLMRRSKVIVHQLADPHEREKDESIVSILLKAPACKPAADPMFLAASCRGLRVLLDEFALDLAKVRNEFLEQVAHGLEEMAPMLEYLDGGTREYKTLFANAERHVSERMESVSKKSEPAPAPSLPFLYNPLVHECFEAILLLVTFFTADARKGVKTSDDISKKMNTCSRERRLFKLLQVPSARVRTGVMNCLQEIEMTDLSNEEVGYLVEMLTPASASNEVATESNLFEKVVSQLKSFLSDTRPQRGGILALRTMYAERSVTGVLAVMRANFARQTLGDQKADMEQEMLKDACIGFLQVASRVSELRTHLRTPKASGSLVEGLKHEERILEHREVMRFANVDASLECTWTGRSVETLLGCLAGPEKLIATGIMTARVLYRLADVLQGVPDVKRRDCLDNDEQKHMVLEHLDREERERQEWNVAEMRDNIKRLHSEDRDDLGTQQMIFGSFGGMTRIVKFLMGMKTMEERAEERTRNMKLMISAKAFTKAMLDQIDEVGETKFSGMYAQHDADKGFMQFLADHMEENNRIMSHTQTRHGDYPKPLWEYLPVVTIGPEPSSGVDLAKEYPQPIAASFSIAFFARLRPPVTALSTGRLIDFGNSGNMDTVVVAVKGGCRLIFSVCESSYGEHVTLESHEGISSELAEYLFTVDDDGRMAMYRDGHLLAERMKGKAARHPVTRSHLCVGKSLVAQESGFYAELLHLRVWSGCAMSYVDVEPSKLQTVVATEKSRNLLLQSIHIDQSSDETIKIKQSVGHFGVYRCMYGKIPRTVDSFIVEGGRVNPAFVVSAMLRCAYSVLTLATVDVVQANVKQVLISPVNFTRLRSLVRWSGIFEYNVAAKFLRLMSCLLEAAPERKMSELEVINLYVILDSYLEFLCPIALQAMVQDDDESLSGRGRVLCVEIVTLLSTMTRGIMIFSLPGCSAEQRNTLIKITLHKIFSSSMILFMVDLLLIDTVKQGSSMESMQLQNTMYSRTRQVLSSLMRYCPKMEYTILETFAQKILTSYLPQRRWFLTWFLDRVKLENDLAKLEHKFCSTSFQQPKSLLRADEPGDVNSGLIVFAAYVDAYVGGQKLAVANPSKKGARIVIVVTREYLFLLDASSPSHPEMPAILYEKSLDDITRISECRMGQVLYIGFAMTITASAMGEEFVAIMMHEKTYTGLLTSTLQSLSVPPGGTSANAAPVQRCPSIRMVLRDIITEGVTISDFALDSQGALKLFVMSDTRIVVFEIIPSLWAPLAGDDSSSHSEKEGTGGKGGLAEVLNLGEEQDEGDDAVKLAGDLTVKRDKCRDQTAAQQQSQGGYGFAWMSGGTKQEYCRMTTNPKHFKSLVKIYARPDKCLVLEFASDKIHITFFDEMTLENWKAKLKSFIVDDKSKRWEDMFKDESAT